METTDGGGRQDRACAGGLPEDARGEDDSAGGLLWDAGDEAGRLRFVCSFPEALGTGIVINTAREVDSALLTRMRELMDGYEAALSRFRDDSVLASMAGSKQGGTFDFPDYCSGLFDLYDLLYQVTDGGVDPAVGADLERLGYGRDLTLVMQEGARDHLGRIHGRATWGRDVVHEGSSLTTAGPVHLDFGAAGKGFLVDLLADLLEGAGHAIRTSAVMDDEVGGYVIDAGGDMRIRSPRPIAIGMEDPDDLARAVGKVEVASGSFCASAPSRRRWGKADLTEGRPGLTALHHILNAVDGLPVQRVEATWVLVGGDQVSPADGAGLSNRPTALADGLCTALFLCDPGALADVFDFSCALLGPDRRALMSQGFPGEFFTA